MCTIRNASTRDSAEIAAILTHEIIHGTAHFGLTPPTADQVATLITNSLAHAFVVAEIDDRVVGFARSSPWKSREAYAWTAEVGIYVHVDHQGKGIGKSVLRALIDKLERRGFHTVLGGVALPNPASVGLLESVGFAPCGILPAVGFKHGAWHDVGYWARQLADGTPDDVPSIKKGA